MPPPQISIVVPAYKAAPYLAATLDSVLAQTRTDRECVVVDDGSPDESAAIAEAYAARDGRFRVLRQANAGVAAARNAGYALTSVTAKYAIFLDSDDVWEPEALTILSAALEADPEAAGAHGLTQSIGADGALQNDFFVRLGRERYGYEDGRVTHLRPDQPTTFVAMLMRFTVYPPALALVRRSVLERVGPWEGSLSPAEDWDMLVRVGRHGYFVFVDTVVARYRRHGENATTTSRGHWSRKQRLFRRAVTDPAADPAQTRLIFDAYRAWNRHIRARRMSEGRTALRQRRWRDAGGKFAWCALMFFVQAGSTLDLRLSHARKSHVSRP